ncbi:MAG TPA: response regulator transcription factor [Allosphingosinicella sp.]|nr:response regulator transcription factor [Allosphingosinicella sp.]
MLIGNVKKADQPLDVRPGAVVVSDVLLYREGLASGLGRTGDFERVVGASPDELPTLLEEFSPQVMFVDVSRAGSCAAARLAKRLAPQLLVIGFGMSSDDQGVAGAEAGVTAFIDHEGTIDDLSHAAKRALNGVPVCPPPLMACLLRRVEELAFVSGGPAANAHLTQREREVASLVETGLSNKEIAGTLKISPATVKNHVHMILDKLNLPRRRLIAVDRQSQPPKP